MRGTTIDSSERAKLQLFRRVAGELRATAGKPGSQGPLRMVRGYVESEGEGERLRALCIPVRRVYLERDPLNFLRILRIVQHVEDPTIRRAAEELEGRYRAILDELASTSILNDRRVRHGEMFETWIDAVVFYDMPDKRRRYVAMLDELGKVVEGIGLHLARQIAGRVLELDDIVAKALGEGAGGHDTARGSG